MEKFEVGQVYQMRFITDCDLRPKFKCTKITPKRATFERVESPRETITRGIKVWRGVQYVREGNYSMAPIIDASDKC